MPIASSTRFVAVLSEKAIISLTASLRESVAPSEKWLVKIPEPGTLSATLRVNTGIEIDERGSRLPVGLHHHGELDQAGRRHDEIGMVAIALRGAQVLHRDSDLALVGAIGARSAGEAGRTGGIEPRRFLRERHG